MKSVDVIIVGGGAAGIFSALQIAEQTSLKILVLEATQQLLSKVKISGGGRCNVTHAYSPPTEFSKNYPRGQKEIRSGLSNFSSSDMQEWLSKYGVKTKTESDGRVFPTSNSSQSIIDCFLQLAEKKKIQIEKSKNVKEVLKKESQFRITLDSEIFESRYLILATGSRTHSYELARMLGHKIIDPVPSLFSFNIEDQRLKDLSGISFSNVQIETKPAEMIFRSEGPLLITHWGLSGPAILKLSSFAAPDLNRSGYKFSIKIDFIPETSDRELQEKLLCARNNNPNLLLKNFKSGSLPNRYWERILEYLNLLHKNCSEVSNSEIESIKTEIKRASFHPSGRTTYKDEFVTAGGVDRKEIDFSTMESKICQRLFFAGELIDVDAVTGGYNFQNCWSGATLIAENLKKLEAKQNSA